MVEQSLAWRVERVCLAAWPALHQIEQNGWVLRFAEGLTRRANSVNATRADVGDIASYLDSFAAAYTAEKLPLIVRVPTLLPQTDRVLDRLDFNAEGESCMLYGDLADVDLKSDDAVKISPQPDDTWFAAMARLQNQIPAHHAIYRCIVGRIDTPAGFATLRIGDAVAAAAFGALHEGLFCCESVVVDATLRGQGMGTRLMRALFHHARGIGLSTEVSRYHYRRAPPSK